jgi:hypothetical protein
MHTCHHCQQLIPHHDDDCRVTTDLQRFERVYRRLVDEQRNPKLVDGLAHYLERHGLLPQG